MDERLRQRLDALPRLPGVYLFRGREGEVLYVGKARDLRARVRSYFQPGRSDERFFVRLLDGLLGDIETVVTGSDTEALLLESSLIKEHRPRYNVRLRDDKDFLHLKLDLEAEWPRLELVRRPRLGGPELLFGPYPSAQSARKTMLLASRHFRLRTCKDAALRGRSRPCLLHQMGRCPAPCVIEADREAYLEAARLAALFLAGRHAELGALLAERMRAAAAALDYEGAALYRDRLRALEATLARQRVVELADVDRDVVGLAREGGRVTLVVMAVRDGRVLHRRDFHFSGQEFPDSELLSSFLAQYYEKETTPPPEVLLPTRVEEAAAHEALLAERAGRRVRLLAPLGGRRADLVRLATANARQMLAERGPTAEDRARSLEHLARRLGLAGPPGVIECVDVAHDGRGRAVAAIAVLVDGEVAPARGRSYALRIAEAGDDYGSMYEVLSRRFRRAVAGEPGWEPPDLLVLDGGRGQLGVALAAARDAGLEDLPMVALAKERPEGAGAGKDDGTVDRVYQPGRVNPVPVRGGSSLLLLSRARDEAHRLAGKGLARRRRARMTSSALERVPGVGAKLRTALLRHFGSIRAVRAASVEQLGAVRGVGSKLAASIHAHLHDEA